MSAASAYEVVPRVRAGVGRGLAWLEDARPLYVLSALLVVEWLTILAVALSVQRNGWIYYQGGDQLWHWAASWLMGQGLLTHTAVGYAWTIVLFPFALIAGPNLVSALPAILLFNVLVLMPVAFFSMYGIGERIGGRLFGYWTAALWIIVPLVGIKYADTGYHQRYTELLLPQSYGLTVMPDFPSMVVLAAAAYFTLRAAQLRAWGDAALAGLLAGVALGIKPSNAPFIVGAALALLAARRWRGIVAFGAALVPGGLALAIWKARGEGNVPLFSNASPAMRLAAGAHEQLVGFSLNLHQYLGFDWHWFQHEQLDSLGSHFWSLRVLEWLVVAGLIGLFRRSRPAAFLFGGWFLANVFIKWGSPKHGSTVDNSDILRKSIFTIPAFLMLIAAVVLLFPGVSRRLRQETARDWGTRRLRLALAGGLLAVFTVAPAALAMSLPRLSNSDTLLYYTQNGTSLSAPFTIDSSWRPHAGVGPGGVVRVTWPTLRSIGGQMNYVVLRAPAGHATSCDVTGGGAQCQLLGAIEETNGDHYVQRLRPGRWVLRVAAKASWVDDPQAGDIYVAGPPVVVTVR